MNKLDALARRWLPAGLLAAALPLAAAAQEVLPIIGEATMVIGTAKLASVDGAARLVERGTPIRIGDRVETEAGGHVHVRFVDGGRLSVRPLSRLQVENYSHSAQQPAQTAIRFRLDEGVVRSITGSWGEAARDRFRLNTPVAAIGVKGTDFIVKSDAEKTSASVYTGAIVFSSLVDVCRATLGPCRNGSEKLLSEDMKGQLLEVSRLQNAPILVAAVDTGARNFRVAPGDVQGRNDKVIVADVSPSSAALTVDKSLDKALVDPVRNIPEVALPDPKVQQLAWGRSPWTQHLEGDLSRTFAEASANGRQSLVGNGSYTLFRDASAPASLLLSGGESAANFRLAAGQAQLSRAGGAVVESAVVQGGTLNVDFARSTFATQLSVSNATMGSQSVVSSGTLQPNGVLLGTTGNAYVAGGLSVDGKEAGYFFERTLPVGGLRGITLWGR